MSWDEFARMLAYVVVSPTFMFFAFVHYNHGERVAAAVLGGLSSFFLLLMTGLLLVRYAEPSREALYVNTVIIVTVAVLSVVAAVGFIVGRRRTAKRTMGIEDAIREMENARQGRLPGGA